MYPLRLVPLLKERPWGVRSLAPWITTEPLATPIGEAWYTSNETRLEDGSTLGDAIAAQPEGILGRGARAGICPLLLKFLFTSARLSVQVHPDDEYAERHHGSLGKTEAWHVLDAAADARLGLGFTRVLGRAEAVQAATTGAIEHLLDWRPTAVGDTWLVPAGTVHAIGAGLTVLEVQEHSDLTYRLFDYGRPRELHLDRGFEVATLGPYAIDNRRLRLGPGRERLTACRYFTLERWEVDGRLDARPDGARYHLAIVAAGRGAIAGQATARGDVWLLPAAAAPFEVTLTGGVLLLAYAGEQPTSGFTRS